MRACQHCTLSGPFAVHQHILSAPHPHLSRHMQVMSFGKLPPATPPHGLLPAHALLRHVRSAHTCPISAALKTVYRRYNMVHSPLGVNRMSRRVWNRTVQDAGLLQREHRAGSRGKRWDLGCWSTAAEVRSCQCAIARFRRTISSTSSFGPSAWGM